MKNCFKYIKENCKEMIAGLFISCRQATKVIFPKNGEMAGNLDPFYLCAPLYIYENIKNREKLKRAFLYVVPLILYALFQILVLNHLNLLRLFVNCAKIIICLFTLFYVKDHWKKFSIYNIVKYSSVFIFITTFLSFFFTKSKVLWRFHDIVNKYNEIRLQGLFLEPSELGFHAMILMIFLVGYFIAKKDESVKKRREILILMGMNLITLYFARSFGSIVIGVLAFFAMFLYNIVRYFTKKKLKICGLVLLVSTICFVIMYYMENPIIMRLIDTVTGKDASNWYRIEVSFNVLKQSLIDYHGVGFGFGNLNTEAFSNKYAYLSLVQVVANSFQYFIIEGGIFAIFSLIILWYQLIRRSFQNISYIKVGILCFLFCYQIFGGHFTSGLIWALYGLCMSDFRECEEV